MGVGSCLKCLFCGVLDDFLVKSLGFRIIVWMVRSWTYIMNIGFVVLKAFWMVWLSILFSLMVRRIVITFCLVVGLLLDLFLLLSLVKVLWRFLKGVIRFLTNCFWKTESLNWRNRGRLFLIVIVILDMAMFGFLSYS